MYHSVKKQYRPKIFFKLPDEKSNNQWLLMASPGYQCYKRLFFFAFLMPLKNILSNDKTRHNQTITELNQPIEIYYQPTFSIKSFFVVVLF